MFLSHLSGNNSWQEEENSRNNLLAELYAKAEDLNTQLATICPLGWTTGPPKAGSLLFLQLLKQLELLSGMTENLQRSYQHYQAEYSEMTLQLNAMLAGRAAVYEHLEQEVNPVKVEPERT